MHIAKIGSMTAGLVYSGLLYVGVAMAQTQWSEKPEGDGADSAIEVIIVTATKRETPLQDAPLSIGVLN